MQLTHIALSIIWNVAGIVLVSQGLRSPGPTASAVAVGILILLGVLIIVGIIYWRPLYFIASELAIIGAMMAINQALTADQSLWPSEFWRYAGAALNALGVLGGTLGITAAVSALMREAKR